MNSPFQQSSGLKDLWHMAILLCIVPLLFFGAYSLVSESASIDAKTEPASIIKKTEDAAKPILEAFFPPAPNEAWLIEIDQLDLTLADLSFTYIERKQEIAVIRSQLAEVRRHCDTFKHEVPSEVGSSALGDILVRIRTAMKSLSQKLPDAAPVADLEQTFASELHDRQQKRNSEIGDAYQQQSKSVIAKHSAQLEAIKRTNRELDDQAQQLRYEANRLLLDMETKVATNAKKKAYEPDKAEIQRLLSPFISPAYSKLGEYNHIFLKTVDAVPLSYRDLERLGALEPTIKGLTSLAVIGSAKRQYESDGRPMGAFPMWNEFTFEIPRELEKVKRAQQLLLKHGEYLIEAGLLLP